MKKLYLTTDTRSQDNHIIYNEFIKPTFKKFIIKGAKGTKFLILKRRLVCEMTGKRIKQKVWFKVVEQVDKHYIVEVV